MSSKPSRTALEKRAPFPSPTEGSRAPAGSSGHVARAGTPPPAELALARCRPPNSRAATSAAAPVLPARAAELAPARRGPWNSCAATQRRRPVLHSRDMELAPARRRPRSARRLAAATERARPPSVATLCSPRARRSSASSPPPAEVVRGHPAPPSICAPSGFRLRLVLYYLRTCLSIVVEEVGHLVQVRDDVLHRTRPGRAGALCRCAPHWR